MRSDERESDEGECDEDECIEEECDEEESDEDEGDEEGEKGQRHLRRIKGLGLHRFEDKDDKRQRKAAAKAVKAGVRLNKTPKHVKKAKKRARKKV